MSGCHLSAAKGPLAFIPQIEGLLPLLWPHAAMPLRDQIEWGITSPLLALCGPGAVAYRDYREQVPLLDQSPKRIGCLAKKYHRAMNVSFIARNGSFFAVVPSVEGFWRA